MGPDGNSLLVPEQAVHKTRVSLMGRELPLHGAVGFELFNNMEFGVSDFVQKINFQRALQGELTRTILAIDEVQSARVHLALTEQGLFRKDASKSKASVTVVTKPGLVLQSAQVQGDVVIKVEISPDGLVRSSKVLSGPSMLREAAAAALKQ